MSTIAVFPGTFDPLTYGHWDIIQRAAGVFDTVLVAVAKGQHKTPLLPLEQRLNVIADVAAGYPNIKVQAFDGLLVNFLQLHQATCVIRGLRHTGDVEYEVQLHDTHKQLYPAMETLFLLPAPHYRSISSTFVREVARLGGDIMPFVPPAVKKAVMLELGGQR